MHSKKIEASIAAISSAVFYGVSIPFVKLLGGEGSASWVSGILYLGAALSMLIIMAISKMQGRSKEFSGKRLGLKEVPKLALMVALNAGSAIALIAGIALSDAATASLLGNLEVVTTALFAWMIFRESITSRVALALALITISGVLLSWSGSGISFSPGALLIVLACILWGLENNCTRSLSVYNVVSVTFVKGLFTGLVSCVIGVVLSEPAPASNVGLLICVGAVSYGLSIVLYIWAQRYIGAARTGNYYSIAPFVGVAVSWLIFGFDITPIFVIALVFALGGIILTGLDVSKVDEACLHVEGSNGAGGK